jgi:beta-mannosidase
LLLATHHSLPFHQIRLWWPNGLGAQPLYNVTATWTSAAVPTQSTMAVRRTGFRVFALVTINDTDAAAVAANATAEGTGKHGMFFRVNGAALYSRGANLVPMEELEGRLDAEAHRILVRSAADAGMNTLRVWGGGIFFPSALYDAADELGVMLYHDMQYASDGGGAHGPIVTATQDAELRHQIRRLSHHPAIVLWDGVNEVVVTPNTSSDVVTIACSTHIAGPIRSYGPPIALSTSCDLAAAVREFRHAGRRRGGPVAGGVALLASGGLGHWSQPAVSDA